MLLWKGCQSNEGEYYSSEYYGKSPTRNRKVLVRKHQAINLARDSGENNTEGFTERLYMNQDVWTCRVGKISSA